MGPAGEPAGGLAVIFIWLRFGDLEVLAGNEILVGGGVLGRDIDADSK